MGSVCAKLVQMHVFEYSLREWAGYWGITCPAHELKELLERRD